MNEEKVIVKLDVDNNGNVIGAEFEYPVLCKQYGDFYFVQCPIFKTIGKSKVSFDDAENDHAEEITEWLSIHIERGTIRSVLKSLGFNRKQDGNYSTPEIPSYLLSNQHRQRVAV